MTNRMEIPACPVAGLKLALDGMSVKRHYCRFGQDYDCLCNYCNEGSYLAACKAAKEWNEKTAEHRAWVAQVTGALACLAMIGRVMTLVASMPGAFRAFAMNAAALFNEVPQKGATYRVTGKRGNAVKHHGKVGVCKWIGESDYAPRRAGWRGRQLDNRKPTISIALAVEGEAKFVYVPFGQVDRIHDSVEVIAAKLETAIAKIAIAEAGVRPRWTGAVPSGRSKKKVLAVAHVVSGRDSGASGQVFWIGADKRTGEVDARLGIRCDDGSVVWASAYDCRNEAPTAAMRVDPGERALIERIAADAVMNDKPEMARELLASVA